MTTNPIPTTLAAGDGLEETPSGRMSSEWLDAVWDLCIQDGDFKDAWFKHDEGDFTTGQLALLATMQDVGPEEAAKRLTGETECTQ